MTEFLQWAYKAIVEHEAIVGLFLLAFIVTMPSKLPSAPRELPQWLWSWVHDGLKVFVNFKSPNPPGQTTSETDTKIHTVEQVPDPNDFLRAELPQKEVTQ